jgi:hypothetical protein
VLQQDNDPTHNCASTSIAEWGSSARRSVTLLEDWPPHSPDLSPIENAWAYVDGRVQAKGCKTIQELEQAVEEELAAFPKETLRKYYDGMDQRMEAVIAAGGDRIRH